MVVESLFGATSSARAFSRQDLSEKEVEAKFGGAPTWLTYGEFDLDGFFELLRAAAPREGETFVDVGSGCGRLVLAASEPEQYAAIMHDAHLSIAAFGGTFLMMVGLGFFFDGEKDIHWVQWLERTMSSYAGVRGIEVAVVLLIVLGFTTLHDDVAARTFLKASIWGLLTFLLVEVLGGVLDRRAVMAAGAQGGLGAFLYLEVLDASFSFDGVIGAFALSQNLFVIAIGLGIGAMYVRSMTIMLVEQGTLYAVLGVVVLLFAIVLGGLFEEQTTMSREQVPLLGDIPIIGELFKYTDETMERNTGSIVFKGTKLPH